MNKYKIFTTDSNGQISFTKEQLEELLNEVYQSGYEDGKKENHQPPLQYEPGVRGIPPEITLC